MRNETWSLARRYDPAVTPFLLVLAAMVLVAMLLGVHLFGQFAMNPAMAAVDAVTYIRVKRSFDLVVPRFAKPLMVAALVATAAALVAALSLEAHVAVACGVGLVALVVTLLAIVRGDLPINRAMAGWSPEAPPEDWQRVRARWELFFAVRAAANALALLALIVAVVPAALALP